VKHGVLLGDPSHFRIKGGRNFYTRNAWGFRKKVDRPRALGQWKQLKATLERLDAKVFTIGPYKEYPGMAFPANAGFLHPKYDPIPFTEKKFYLSRLTPHRQGESAIYCNFLRRMGAEAEEFPFLFEGEADFFPCGEFFIFTYGDIVPTGFRLRLGVPPWRYRFSHRSDVRNIEILRKIVSPHPVLGVKLADVRYYHGDTALFAFGPKHEHLLAYLDALEPSSADYLKQKLGSLLHPMSRQDAEAFVANSFQLQTPEGPHILFPTGVSSDVKALASSLGIPHTLVDVSEFFEKGGGSIKCLLCDLGPVDSQG